MEKLPNQSKLWSISLMHSRSTCWFLLCKNFTRRPTISPTKYRQTWHNNYQRLSIIDNRYFKNKRLLLLVTNASHNHCLFCARVYIFTMSLVVVSLLMLYVIVIFIVQTLKLLFHDFTRLAWALKVSRRLHSYREYWSRLKRLWHGPFPIYDHNLW